MTYAALVSDAAAALIAARAELAQEIADYPTPVSGCDAQYTHLIAERNRVAAALRALGSDVFVATPRTLTPRAGVESR